MLALLTWPMDLATLHPSIMYLPAVVLCLGPVFLLLAIFTSRYDKLLVIALLMMILGLVTMYSIAVAQGVALPSIPGENSRHEIDHYRSLLVLAWDSFAVATLLLALLWGLQRFFRLRLTELMGILPIGFFVFYALGLYWLLSATCQEERLLEESGIFC